MSREDNNYELDRDDAQAAAPASGGDTYPSGDRHRCVVFVGNLPFQTPWQNIKDEFGKAGRVRYTDLIADKQGRPKGSALVTFSNPEGAAAAVRMFNEVEFCGRRIIVREFNDGPRPTIVQKSMMPEYRRRDAGGRRTGDDGNEDTFGGRGGAGGASRGGGGAGGQRGGGGGAASNGPAAGGNFRKGGKNDPTAPPSNPVPKPRSDGARIFVSNLPFDCNATALRETFAQIGPVRHAEIITSRAGKSRGMGIVVMETPKLAALAISEFHGIEMAGRPMHVRLDNAAN